MTKLQVGFIIDEPSGLNTAKDTSIVIMEEVARLGGEIFICRTQDLFVSSKIVYAKMSRISLNSDPWYKPIDETVLDLAKLTHIWMRKDPPVNDAYIYTTHLLDLVINKGGCVLNSPKALRDFNEKLFTLHFNIVPESIVASSKEKLLAFVNDHSQTVLKTLDSYGGRGVFLLNEDDLNKENIIDLTTNHGKTPVILQRFIKEISEGDKRVLILNGKPFEYALLRVPKPGDLRGNIDAGASYKAVKLTDNDLKICQEISNLLVENGIVFAGIDIIGNYCTEINITSPTCMRQLAELTDINIANILYEGLLNGS